MQVLNPDGKKRQNIGKQQEQSVNKKNGVNELKGLEMGSIFMSNRKK